jgi:hypothetical protein
LTSASARRSAIFARTPGCSSVSIISTSVSSASVPASTQKHERLGWIAYDHAHHCVINGVGCSQRVMLISAFGQSPHTRAQAPGTICKKDCELGGRFDGERWVHAAFNVKPGMASDNSGKSARRDSASS